MTLLITERTGILLGDPETSQSFSTCYFNTGPQWCQNEFKSGGHVRGEAPEKCCCCSTLFFCSKSNNIRFVERFCGGQYSLASFLFAVLVHTVLPCQVAWHGSTVCTRTAHAPSAPCLMESAHCRATNPRVRQSQLSPLTLTKAVEDLWSGESRERRTLVIAARSSYS